MNIVCMHTHKDVVGLYNRPFPHNLQLAEVSGKDRVNRKGVGITANAK